MTSEQFWATVFAVGAFQGAFLAAVLAIRRDNRRLAPRVLAGIIATFTVMIGARWIEPIVRLQFRELLVALNIHTELAIGPLLLLFTHSVLDPERRWTWQDALQLLPLVAGYAFGVGLWALRGYGVDGGVFDGLGPFVRAYAMAKFTFLATYVVLSLLVLDRGIRRAPRSVTKRRRSELAWLRGAYGVVTVAAGLSYAAEFVSWIEFLPPIEPEPLSDLLLTGTIYLGTLMLLVRPSVLTLQAKPVRSRWRAQSKRLLRYFDRERPWLEPELTLDHMAEAVGLTVNRLSAVLNEGLDTTFYALLTRYRLAEFERLVHLPEARSRSILDLAFEAGFNSKASFYRAFREAHGTTPSAYRGELSTAAGEKSST